MVKARLRLAVAAVAAWAGAAAAQPLPSDVLDPDGSAAGVEATLGAALGPEIVVEAIAITGNHSTARRLIERALPFAVGATLRPSDPRLSRARYKLLALGYFLDVSVVLRKGSARGQVIVAIHVIERGTVALNRLWFGTSAVAPWWLGADLSDRNLAGTGLVVGGAAAYAGAGSIVGARPQWAGEVRVAAPAVAGSRWGAHASLTGQHGSEAFRVTGPIGTTDPDNLRAFPYRRLGGRAGATFAWSTLTAITADVRVEGLTAALPTAPTRTFPDGTSAAIDLGLPSGTSRVVSLGLGVVFDNRPDPALPHQGSRVEVAAELGSAAVSDYDFAVLLGRYDRFWPLDRRHAVGVRLAGGAVLGDAARFDRIHVADVNRMLSPRVLGMTTAMASPIDFIGTDHAEAVYGKVGGSAVVEYAYRWWRRPRRIYGGDLFVAAGAWALAGSADPGASGTLPVELILDAGLRIDTEIGVFEFSVSNALGRVPRW